MNGMNASSRGRMPGSNRESLLPRKRLVLGDITDLSSKRSLFLRFVENPKSIIKIDS